MAINRVSFSALSAAAKKLDRLEQIVSQFKKHREKPPVLIVSFLMFGDQTVPNVLDRPLHEWMIFDGHSGVVEVSPMLEYELRRLGHDVFECPDNMRIPYEIFVAWLGEQEEKMYGIERKQTTLGVENG